jgi:hypothetical protein
VRRKNLLSVCARGGYAQLLGIAGLRLLLARKERYGGSPWHPFQAIPPQEFSPYVSPQI